MPPQSQKRTADLLGDIAEGLRPYRRSFPGTDETDRRRFLKARDDAEQAIETPVDRWMGGWFGPGVDEHARLAQGRVPGRDAPQIDGARYSYAPEELIPDRGGSGLAPGVSLEEVKRMLDHSRQQSATAAAGMPTVSDPLAGVDLPTQTEANLRRGQELAARLAAAQEAMRRAQAVQLNPFAALPGWLEAGQRQAPQQPLTPQITPEMLALLRERGR